MYFLDGYTVDNVKFNWEPMEPIVFDEKELAQFTLFDEYDIKSCFRRSNTSKYFLSLDILVKYCKNDKTPEG